MTDEPETLTAPIVFGDVEVAGLRRKLAMGVFDDEVYVGIGKTPKEAIDSLFHSAFPDLKETHMAPGFAWSPHLKDGPLQGPTKRVYMTEADPIDIVDISPVRSPIAEPTSKRSN